MHLGSGILHFCKLLKKITYTEALWQSLKRELKQHIRKIWPLLLPGALDILLRNKVSSNIHPPCWHSTVPLVMIQGKKLDSWPRFTWDPFSPLLQRQTPRSLEAAPPHEPSLSAQSACGFPASGLDWQGFTPSYGISIQSTFISCPANLFATSPPCIIPGKRSWLNAAELLFFGHPSTSPQTTSLLVQSAVIAVKEAQI